MDMDDMMDMDDTELPEIETEVDDTPPEEFRIGVIGYDTDDQFEYDQAYAELVDMINEVVSEAEIDENTKILIVSNVLDQGMSKVAYDIADESGYDTVGIFPSELVESADDIRAVDEAIQVGEEIGSDDEYFIEYIDVLLRVGESSFGDTTSKMELAEEKDIPTVEIDL